MDWCLFGKTIFVLLSILGGGWSIITFTGFIEKIQDTIKDVKELKKDYWKSSNNYTYHRGDYLDKLEENHRQLQTLQVKFNKLKKRRNK